LQSELAEHDIEAARCEGQIQRAALGPLHVAGFRPGHGQHGPVEVYADQPSDVAALGQPSRHDTGPARHVQYAFALRRLDAIE